MKTIQMYLKDNKTLLGIILAVVGSSFFSVIINFFLSIVLTSVVAFSTGASGDVLLNKVEFYYDKYYFHHISLILSLLALIIVFLLLMGKTRALSILKGFKSKKTILYSLLVGVGFVIVSTLYTFLTSYITNQISNSNQAEVIKLVHSNYFLSFIYIVILAPLVEEIGMRYFVFGSLKTYKKWLAYLCGSGLFALLHFVVLIGQSNINIISELLAIPTYFGAGLLLCYAYDKSEKLACPIIIHLLNNLISFIFVLL